MSQRRHRGQATNETIITIVLIALVVVIVGGLYGRTLASKFRCAAESLASGQGLTTSCPANGADRGTSGGPGGGQPGGGEPGRPRPASPDGGSSSGGPSSGGPSSAGPSSGGSSSGGPSSGGPSSGGSNSGGSNPAGGGSPQDRLQEARDLLANSPRGQRLLDYLDRNGIPIELVNGQGTFYDPPTAGQATNPNGRVVLDDSLSAAEMGQAVAHEQTHASWELNNQSANTEQNFRNVGRAEYVDRMLNEEAHAVAAEMELRRELRDAGVTLPPHRLEQVYQEAYDRAAKRPGVGRPQNRGEAAGRAAIRREFDNGNIRTSTTHETYPDFYGREHDQSRGAQPPQPESGKTAADGSAAQPTIGFASDVSPKVADAVERFNRGEIGASVKNFELLDKTPSQVKDEIGTQGGGWESAGKDEKGNDTFKTADGKWRLSEGEMVEGGEKVKLVFYENLEDGGVIRLKPGGVPNSPNPSMQGAHGAVYVKVENREGATGFDNEAFKVENGTALPKWPNDLAPPPGVEKYNQKGLEWLAANPNAPPPFPPRGSFTDEFEAHIRNEWAGRTHVRMTKDP